MRSFMRPRHSKKEIEDALAEAEAAGWSVLKREGHTHAWGLLRCKHGCCQQTVNSTPRVPENEASRIRRAVRRCPGQEDTD
jgi:hypothetical protein